MKTSYMIIGLLSLSYITYKGAKVVRGIRNNNAGNLRITGDKWLGLKETQTDDEFFQFTEPVYGIRAMARVLLNYEQNHGLTTLRQIISRYAPASENDTESYIKSISDSMSLDKNNKFFDRNPDDYFLVSNNLIDLIPAMIKHENGFNPYSNDLILEGISLATS